MNQEIIFLNDEHVVRKLRKHRVILLRDTFGTCVAGFLPFILIAILQTIFPRFAEFPGYTAFASFATILWLIIVWTALSALWTNYYLDLWIVTNKRIISVDQIGLFNRKVTSLQVDRIQEIIVKEENLIQAFFRYGTLDIETASPTDGDATMEGIPRPEDVRKVILSQLEKKESVAM